MSPVTALTSHLPRSTHTPPAFSSATHLSFCSNALLPSAHPLLATPLQTEGLPVSHHPPAALGSSVKLCGVWCIIPQAPWGGWQGLEGDFGG